MKTKQNYFSIRFLGFIAATLLFNFLFWNENLGINSAIYSFTLLTFLSILDFEKLKNKKVLIPFIGSIVTAVGVIYNNSLMSKYMHLISMGVFATYYYQSEIKSIYYAIPTSIINFFYSTGAFVQIFSGKKEKNPTKINFKKWIKLLVIPTIISFAFYLVYVNANPIIKEFVVKTFNYIYEYLEEFFKHYPFTRFLFIIFGAITAAFFFYYKKSNVLINVDKNQNDDIPRRSKLRIKHFKMLDLLNEYRTALLTLLLLNGLIFFVNAVDIYTVWFNYDIADGAELSKQLHKGVYLLIFSILMSIGVVIYFFRGNLNYINRGKKLKTTTYIWLIQNILLSITVLIKTWHYVQNYGMAYKRIGVFIFITLTITGLLLMFSKLKHKKSVFYLLRQNAWAAYLLFIGLSFVNWDAVIIKHNLAKTSPVDYKYLLSLSDKGLPLLAEESNNIYYQESHPEEMRKLDRIKSIRLFHKKGSASQLLNEKIQNFKRKQNEHTWLSWNFADQKTVNYFNEKELNNNLK